ncbi:Actin-regulating kinase PRK1 [Candida viswanathii]|uniref:non-specific serine/threonine protein kinase n=1 Tax=Candida viswanathii TaxID=5486 RepID=A0A367Y9L5_9ASCO|nr:Actin-regulating kinase PRK1 [Candida viswanathii]
MPPAPPNAYKPGTKLTVGSHQISIIKYISEGGFAHVYTCNIDPPFQGSSVACLKRVAVPSKWQLSLLRQEVDAMRRLRGNQHIVSYIDSHASRMNVDNTGPENGNVQQQQYEVFLLMEYCERNGLIDFMNTRLTNKLTESEIVDIMYQVTVGVAMCHHLRPPLIHRDIKIENVLIDGKGVFKLCDFGSSVNYMPPPRNPQELQLMKDDLMQHTTPQYRAPEMIDLTKGFPIDDKLDIWALGIFLYKLCYYTTPFERPDQNSLQDLERTILNCSENLRFNDQPGLMFSARLKNVIKVCLRADPRRRPNAVQLLGEIASMKGEKGVPNVIPYSVRESLKMMTQPLPPTTAATAATKIEEIKVEHTLPEVKRTAAVRSDPFASIDKTKILTKVSSPFTLEPVKSPSRPLSAYFEDSQMKRIYSQGNRSSPSVQDYVKKELAKGRESFEYNRDDDGTLEFLKSREDQHHHIHLPVNHDTGGSLKNALKNGLRKISTGGSISANNTGSSVKSNRRKSLKQILTGSRKTPDAEPARDERKTPPSASSSSTVAATTATASSSTSSTIQNRMQQLLKQNDSHRVHKSALGYGRFTDSKVADDIDSINKSLYDNKPTQHRHHHKHQLGRKKLSPPAVPIGLSSRRSESPSIPQEPVKQSRPMSKVRAPPSSGSVKTKPPPPKPKKPTYLKSPEKANGRRLSTSSEISMPDLDDLEKQFSKRFPSYV